MGIHFTCPNGHRLHVKSFLAGKRGICPHCGSRFDIPLTDTGRVEAAVSTTAGAGAAREPTLAVAANSRLRTAEAADGPKTPTASDVGDAADTTAALDTQAAGCEAADWYVRPPSGGQYGPANESLLRQWIRESRVDAESLVWREDWPQWRRAGDIFDELAPARAATHPAFEDIPEPALFTGNGPTAAAVSPTDPGRTDGHLRRSPRRRGQPSRSPGNRAQRLVVLLSLIVAVLAAALVLVVVYFGQN